MHSLSNKKLLKERDALEVESKTIILPFLEYANQKGLPTDSLYKRFEYVVSRLADCNKEIKDRGLLKTPSRETPVPIDFFNDLFDPSAQDTLERH